MPSGSISTGPSTGRSAFSSDAERQASAPLGDEQRLDAEVVTGEDEPAGRLLEQREREHAAEAAKGGLAVVSPRLEQRPRCPTGCGT